MVVLDADSVMTGECLSGLVRLMEANPNAGIIQSSPRASGMDTLYARCQQFATPPATAEIIDVAAFTLHTTTTATIEDLAFTLHFGKFAGLRATWESVKATGNAAHFDVYVLSDSYDPDICGYPSDGRNHRCCRFYASHDDDGDDRRSGLHPALPTWESVKATGNAAHFDVYVLSDSYDPDICVAEQKAVFRVQRLVANGGCRNTVLITPD
jgi:membrane glycosyltransferase